MQVSLLNTSELGRKLSVQVPEEKIQEKVSARLRTLARDVRIDGFRPGKAPQALVYQRYGGKIREEVLGELIYSSYQEAMQSHQLRPAGTPQITPHELDFGQGLSYEADFEVYPEIRLAPLEALAITHPTSAVEEKDLEAMVARLREQRQTWHEVERSAAQGDRLILNFEGTADGENFTDGVTQNFQAVLGNHQLLPDFEAQLQDAKAGDHLEFEIVFPAEYGAANLQGKTAQFKVDVLKVEEAQLPEVDADFAKSYGVESGDIDAFLQDVKENMERELQRALLSKVKNEVMVALYNANPMTLPQGLVDDEIEQLMAPYRRAAEQRQQTFDADAMRPAFETSARRRVALGLIVGEIIQENKIQVDQARVRALLENIAQSYQNPEEVVKWYYANPERLREVEHRVLEDQAMELVLSKAKVTVEPVPFDQMMQQAANQASA